MTINTRRLENHMCDVVDRLKMPAQDPVMRAYLHGRFALVVGLLPTLIILGLLSYYRQAFLNAAAESEKGTIDAHKAVI